jgi:hypothetical protein
MNKNALFLVIFIALFTLSNSLQLKLKTKNLQSAKYPNMIIAGESLKAGEGLLSANGNFKAVMQTDGNLVVYNNSGKTLWASNTFTTNKTKLPYTAVMQDDGNFVIYNVKGESVWASQTWHSKPDDTYSLIMQDDGLLTLYGVDELPKWNTKTAGKK